MVWLYNCVVVAASTEDMLELWQIISWLTDYLLIDRSQLLHVKIDWQIISWSVRQNIVRRLLQPSDKKRISSLILLTK